MRNQKSDGNLNGSRVAGLGTPVPRTDRCPRSIVICARAQRSVSTSKALLFYEGVKEARALPSPQPRRRRPHFRRGPALEIHKTVGAFISDRSSSPKREDSQPCVVGHFVNLSPGLRVDAKRTRRRGAPLGERSGSRLILSRPGKSELGRFSVAQHSVSPGV